MICVPCSSALRGIDITDEFVGMYPVFNLVLTICTSCNNKKLFIFPQCVSGFHMILRKENNICLSDFNRLVFVTEKQWLFLDIGTERFIVMPMKVYRDS